jgi:ATP-dependent Lhr-like helicase
MFGIQDAGRWSLTPRSADDGLPAPAVDAETVEHAARSLLNRYGVVFWRLIEREANWLPPWRDLLRVYRRWEARGEIRGGRFVDGMSGEQFALPDAIGALRKVRQRPDSGELICVSAMDPLNLAGTVLAGDRVARLPGARLLFRDGLPIASLSAGKVEMIEEEVTPVDAERVRQALVRRRGTAADPDTALYPRGLAEALR